MYQTPLKRAILDIDEEEEVIRRQIEQGEIPTYDSSYEVSHAPLAYEEQIAVDKQQRELVEENAPTRYKKDEREVLEKNRKEA